MCTSKHTCVYVCDLVNSEWKVFSECCVGVNKVWFQLFLSLILYLLSEDDFTLLDSEDHSGNESVGFRSSMINTIGLQG